VGINVCRIKAEMFCFGKILVRRKREMVFAAALFRPAYLFFIN